MGKVLQFGGERSPRLPEGLNPVHGARWKVHEVAARLVREAQPSLDDTPAIAIPEQWSQSADPSETPKNVVSLQSRTAAQVVTELSTGELKVA